MHVKQGCGSRDLVLVSRPIKTTFLRSWSWSWSRPCWSWSWSWSQPPWSWSWSWSRTVVLSKTWGYVQLQRYLCRKSKLASECALLFTYLLAFPHLAVSNSYLIYTTTLRTSRDLVLVSRPMKTTFLRSWSWPPWSWSRSRPVWSWCGLGLELPGLDNISGTSQWAVMPCGWEANRMWRRTGHASQTLVVLHLRAQGLEEGDEHRPTVSCGAWSTLP